MIDPLCDAWEGNKDVTSQETCLFLYTRNFRGLKFIGLMDCFRNFMVPVIILFIPILLVPH